MTEFNVYEVFVGGVFERANNEPLRAEAAVLLATQKCNTVGARIGSTCRVFITDGEDFIVWEWRFGEGLVYPTRSML